MLPYGALYQNFSNGSTSLNYMAAKAKNKIKIFKQNLLKQNSGELSRAIMALLCIEEII